MVLSACHFAVDSKNFEDYNRFVHAEAKGLFRSIVTEGNQHEVNPTPALNGIRMTWMICLFMR